MDCSTGYYLSGGNCILATVAFVSSTTYQGNLGGLSGADSKCQALANAVPALQGRTFKAWLSSTSSGPSTRFTQSALTYVTVDSVKVADGWSDLIDGTLDSKINIDENGATQNYNTWTNTKTNGTPHETSTATTCQNWTTSSASYGGRPGNSSYANTFWTEMTSNPRTCDWQTRLYCIEQGAGGPVAP